MNYQNPWLSHSAFYHSDMNLPILGINFHTRCRRSKVWIRSPRSIARASVFGVAQYCRSRALSAIINARQVRIMVGRECWSLGARLAEFIGRIIGEVRRSGLTVVASSTKIKRSLKSHFSPGRCVSRHAEKCCEHQRNLYEHVRCNILPPFISRNIIKDRITRTRWRVAIAPSDTSHQDRYAIRVPDGFCCGGWVSLQLNSL